MRRITRSMGNFLILFVILGFFATPALSSVESSDLKDIGLIFVKELTNSPKSINLVTISNPTVLKTIFPELTNPRPLSIEDIGDSMDKYHFIAGGFTFILTGDFNKDGVTDIALVGKFDDPEIHVEHFFFAIISIKGKYVSRQYFGKLGFQRVFLRIVPNVYDGKFDTILRVYAFETDNCDYLFWKEKKYVTKKCCVMDHCD